MKTRSQSNQITNRWQETAEKTLNQDAVLWMVVGISEFLPETGMWEVTVRSWADRRRFGCPIEGDGHRADMYREVLVLYRKRE